MSPTDRSDLRGIALGIEIHELLPFSFCHQHERRQKPTLQVGQIGRL
jgi:hypothetical protein